MPTTPINLPSPGAALYLQVADTITGDTDLTYGVLAALGNGANSIYPNAATPGPSSDRVACPVPFLICVSGGVRAIDRQTREYRLHLEAHDELDFYDERIAGIIERLKHILVVQEWRPTDQLPTVYTSGLQFESESPLLPDETYQTYMMQLTLVIRARDATSNHGMGKMAGPNAIASGD